MPISIDDKYFNDFNSAVEHVKRTKPEIKDPEAYVASIEQKIAIECPFKKTQNRIKEAMERITSADRKLKRSDKVVDYVLPKEGVRPISSEEYSQLKGYVDTGKKIRPPKPTQKQRNMSMQAKLRQRLAEINTCKYCSNPFRLLNMTPEGDVSCPECDRKFPKVDLNIKKRIAAKEHKHSIQFRLAKRIGEVGEFKGATQEKYWKYWLLNAKQTNGNGWGVDSSSIDKNITKFIGRPFCVTAKQWFPESEYETYEHPYLPTNNLDTIFSHQAKYAVGDIVDIIKDNDDYYAMIKPRSRFSSQSPPAFCSPAIFQLDPREPEDKISKWEALHLAGLDRDPAYGAQVALLKGTCIGTSVECKVQFAQQKVAAVGTPRDFDKEEKMEKDFIDMIMGRGSPPEDTQPSKYKLPSYSENDYRAFHDVVQDPAFHGEEASDAGLSDDEVDTVVRTHVWEQLPEKIKQRLRPYYQKHLSNELVWQKNPNIYIDNKIPMENQTYIKPNFHKNIFDEDDPTYKYTNKPIKSPEDYKYHHERVDPDGKEHYRFVQIHPDDIVPKTTRAFDYPEKYSKQKTASLAYGLEKAMGKATGGDMGGINGSHFISTEGEVYGEGYEDHRNLVERAIREHGDKKLNKMVDDSMEKGNRTDIMNHFMKLTGMVRVNGDNKRININSYHPLTNAQRNIIKSHIEHHDIYEDRINIDDETKDKSIERTFRYGKQKLAVNYDKHYIFDPYTPRQYGKDDTPSLLDQVSDDVEQHAGISGKRLLDGANLHPKSYSKIADTFDYMTRDTLLRIPNNYGNEFEDIRGNEHEVFSKEADDIAEGGKYFHRKDYGMEEPDEIRRPQGQAEELGEALFEPFRRMQDEEMADVPREDFITGNRLIEKFSRELYGKAYKSLKTRGRMMGAKITNLQPAVNGGVHAVIDEDGKLLEKEGSDHFALTKEHFNLHNLPNGDGTDISDQQIHQMLRDNNLIRVQNFTKTRDPRITFQLAKPANKHQMSKIKEMIEDNPFSEIGYRMGHVSDDNTPHGNVSSFNEFKIRHTEAFAGKPQQMEDSFDIEKFNEMKRKVATQPKETKKLK